MKTSAIIPARNEPYLQQTIDSLLNNAKGEIEVIAVLDGYWPEQPIKDDPRVVLIHNAEPKGMRASINAAARIAKGEYLIKTDAHCCFGMGFDVMLADDCKYGWTIIPRRYGLDVATWSKNGNYYDFEYIEKGTLKGRKWPEFENRVKDKAIVDLMTSQGSCWFMHRQRFLELGGLDEDNHGGMGREAQEICLKTWLSGGRYLLNRLTWYAHWSKPKEHVISDKKGKQKSVDYAVDLWMNDKWPMATRKLEWLIEKFAPVPSWETELSAAEYIQKKYKIDSSESHILIDGMSRADLYTTFAELGFKTGCEIGVWEGKNAVRMFEHIPDLKLYLVDPYKNYDQVRKPRGEDRIKNARRRAHRGMEGKNKVFMEMLGEDAVKEIPDNSLDFVYIDGEHTYDMAMLDIILWIRKVKKGGIVSGHDYYHSPKQYMGVKLAVNDYVKANNIKPLYITDKREDWRESKRSARLGGGMASWFWVKE